MIARWVYAVIVSVLCGASFGIIVNACLSGTPKDCAIGGMLGIFAFYLHSFGIQKRWQTAGSAAQTTSQPEA